MLRSDGLQITPEILMLGLDLAEAFHCYLAKGETNTDLRHAQHRSAHFCPVSVMQPTPAVIPADLKNALKAECLTEAFRSIPPGKQNFIIRRIDDAVKPETRERRQSSKSQLNDSHGPGAPHHPTVLCTLKSTTCI